MTTLDWYSKHWRRRDNLWHWIMLHDETRNARENDVSDVAYKSIEAKAWTLYTNDPRYREKKAEESRANGVIDIHLDDDTPADPQYELWDNMSDIEGWHDIRFPVAAKGILPAVIPESFLWTVFDQLVDAFIILGTGGAKKGTDKKWQEMVHLDVTLMNIFAKKAKGAEGGDGISVYDRDQSRAVELGTADVRILGSCMAVLIRVVSEHHTRRF
jgi:hypothetical protein